MENTNIYRAAKSASWSATDAIRALAAHKVEDGRLGWFVELVSDPVLGDSVQVYESAPGAPGPIRLTSWESVLRFLGY